MERVLTRSWGREGSHTLAVYREGGGYEALARALEMEPEAIVAEVKAAHLLGRGGAGFPCGVKWGFVPKTSEKPKYLVVNADEGEPGTFKDRYIISLDPHRLIEGCVIAARAIGAHTCYIYIRGEYVEPARILEGAIAEAVEAGLVGRDIQGSGFDLEIHVHRGAGAYICGEETALLESLEGKPGKPRLKPPFPAVVGAFGGPTIVNNVETIANVPEIVARGGGWFHGLGVEGDGGTRLYSLSGHVARPGVYELPTGFNLKELIFDRAGGVPGGRKLKAVIPGGSSTPILTADEVDVALDVKSLKAAGSMLGSAAIVVMDETTCMVRSLWRLLRFYAHESCGQCTPCREGTYWIASAAGRLEQGRARPGDLELIRRTARRMDGTTICPLASAAAWPALSYTEKFAEEFKRHQREGGCPFGAYEVRPAPDGQAWA